MQALDSLEQGRQLFRLKGTQRILMAHPFSNMPTPYQVLTGDQKTYYANCAWDSIGIHILLRRPVQIKSYCFHCSDPIELALRNEEILKKKPVNVLIHFSKPVSRWLEDIVDTCGNNMNFFGSEEHLQEWKAENPGKPGYTVTFDQIIEMSRFNYRDRLNFDYERPSNDERSAFFASIGLAGDFWQS